MEDRKSVEILKLFILGIFFAIPIFSYAYEPTTTHNALTQEIVKFHNHYSLNNPISDADRMLIMQGSINEDDNIRALNHFYDPVHGKGLVLKGIQFLAAKYWSQDTVAQASNDPVFGRRMYGSLMSLFSSTSDYSWDRAIYEYAHGDKERGLKTLGHILHLIEDMTVPDHTRGDAHPPYADKYFHQASPYEHWADKWNISNINVADTLIKEKQAPLYCNHLNSCFDSIALYSNNNFFSKDTINNNTFSSPNLNSIEIERLRTNEGNFNLFIKNKDIYLARYDEEIDLKTGDLVKKYELTDGGSRVLSSYWSHLSKQAVMHGAGVVKLFFDEVAKEEKTKVLYEKNKSWFAKQWDNARSGVFAFAGALYGTSVKPSDLDDSAFIVSALPEPKQESLPVFLPVPEVPHVPEPAPAPSIKKEVPAVATTSQVSSLPDNGTLTTTPESDEVRLSVDQKEAGFATTTERIIFGGVAVADSAAPDTAAPDISLTVTECSGSFGSSGCVIATTTIAISWTSAASDLASYTVTCTVGGSACTGFPLTNTASTSTTLSVSNTSSYSISVTARDTTGNVSTAATQSVEVQTLPIAINEVAWAGTSANVAHEWIELKNNSSQALSLSSFILYSQTDMTPYIQLSGTIPANGYYLIEKGSDSTVSNVTADLVHSFGVTSTDEALGNSSAEVLAISRASTTIDQMPAGCGGSSVWCGGDSTQRYTMERISSRTVGTDQSNWTTANIYIHNGQDSAGTNLVAATPKQRNSATYLVSQTSTLSADTTLTSSGGPYIIKENLTIPSGKTLIAEAGTVVKFVSTYGISVDGTLQLNGTSGSPVVFTSFSDDSYGGDLNGDGSASSASRQAWNSIDFNSGSAASSTVNYAMFRYGGKYNSAANAAMVKVDSVSPSIKNSTFDYGYAYGLRLINATSTVENNTIQNITGATLTTPAGIFVSGGAPTITGNTFNSSENALVIDTSSTASITSNTIASSTTRAIYVSSAAPTFSGNTLTNNAVNGISLDGTLAQNITLSNDEPYVIPSAGLATNSGTTMTVSAGAVIKFQTTSSSMTVNGLMNVNGSSGSEAIFTSIADDANGGDTGNDGSTTGSAGGWRGVVLANAATSTISYAKFLYGGRFVSGTTWAALKAESSPVYISNSTFSNNQYVGLWLSSSLGSSATSTTFSNNNNRSDTIALLLTSSTPTLGSLTFTNNSTGISATGSTVTNLGGNSYSGNTTDTNPANFLP